MIYTKGILLKGLLGFGVAAGATYGGWSQRDKIAEFFSTKDEPAKPAAALTEATSKLLDEVGLQCNGLETATADNGVVCSKKEGAASIKVKQGEKTFDLSNITEGSKIKVYKDDGYENKFKFVIEDGDISQSSDKLEEFETYEIKEDNTKKYYLTRKTEAKANIKKALGLPDACELPTSSPCTVDSTKINDINFDGKSSVTGTGTLQIAVATSSEKNDFPLGYKFTLTPSGDITINRGSGQGNIVLKNSVATVFKIKKNGTSLSLVEALTKDTLTKKVGLQCTGEASATGVDCSKVESSDAKVKVKQESNTFELSSITNGGGKIKLYKDDGTDNYNGGLKFVIEDGNITESSSSNKLEQFETYEIKQDGTDWKLTRKKKSSEEKRRILGLPGSCTFPDSGTAAKECTINTSDVSSIAFDGKTGATLDGGSATLKVEVTPTTEATDFPLGYKFTLTPTGGTLTINRSADPGNITLNSGTPKEFKIKQNAENKKQLTLEEAWTLTTLAGKVGLSCNATSGAPTATAGVDCTKSGDTEIKVKKDTEDLKVSNITQGKIKVYKTSSGETHNEGFKFVIEENDITATNGGSGSNKLEQFETYEIKKESDGWKLVRKSDAKAGIKKALGLPEGDTECDLPTNGSEKTCTLDNAKFKKINFEGKGEVSDTISGTPKLKISKVSGTENGDFGPFGYKFKLESTEDAKISSSVTIKANTNTEFKIKRATGSNSISLEKAWTAKSLGDKVGLTCPEDNDSNKECTLQDNKVNLKVDDTKKYTELSKKANGDANNKKVKFALDQEGHNQGIKFTAENEICLQGGSNGDDEKKIENGSVTYQILKDSDGKWYLTKKNASQ